MTGTVLGFLLTQHHIISWSYHNEPEMGLAQEKVRGTSNPIVGTIRIICKWWQWSAMVLPLATSQIVSFIVCKWIIKWRGCYDSAVVFLRAAFLQMALTWQIEDKDTISLVRNGPGPLYLCICVYIGKWDNDRYHNNIITCKPRTLIIHRQKPSLPPCDRDAQHYFLLFPWGLEPEEY